MCRSCFVECPYCEGEGYIEHGSPDDGWSEQCATCRGKGLRRGSCHLVDEYDLDDMTPPVAAYEPPQLTRGTR
jgi:hypothetical protein